MRGHHNLQHPAQEAPHTGDRPVIIQCLVGQETTSFIKGFLLNKEREVDGTGL